MLTLETSKKLKEAGWCVVTEFYYYVYVNYQDDWDYKKISSTVAGASLAKKHYYPCPSLEELLVVMQNVSITKASNDYNATYFGKSPMDCRTIDDVCDPSEAVAQLWLKLKAEKLI